MRKRIDKPGQREKGDSARIERISEKKKKRAVRERSYAVTDRGDNARIRGVSAFSSGQPALYLAGKR